MHSSKWDRQELYEKVWQLPLRKLAAEYGVSDVALGKVCRKLQIPLPGHGHWTKIECGHTISHKRERARAAACNEEPPARSQERRAQA